MNTQEQEVLDVSPSSPLMMIFQSYCCSFYVLDPIANGIIAYIERKAIEAYGQESFDLTFRGMYLRIIPNTPVDSLEDSDDTLLRKIYLELFSLPDREDIWIDLMLAYAEDNDESIYTLECSPAAAAIISKNALSMAREAI